MYGKRTAGSRRPAREPPVRRPAHRGGAPRSKFATGVKVRGTIAAARLLLERVLVTHAATVRRRGPMALLTLMSLSVGPACIFDLDDVVGSHARRAAHDTLDDGGSGAD